MSVWSCPLCFTEHQGIVPLENLSAAAGLNRTESLIVELLIEKLRLGASTKQIANHIYQSDPNGGPLDVRINISVQCHKARKKIEPLGWTITKQETGRGGGTLSRRVVRVGVDQ